MIKTQGLKQYLSKARGRTSRKRINSSGSQYGSSARRPSLIQSKIRINRDWLKLSRSTSRNMCRSSQDKARQSRRVNMMVKRCNKFQRLFQRHLRSGKWFTKITRISQKKNSLKLFLGAFLAPNHWMTFWTKSRMKLWIPRPWLSFRTLCMMYTSACFQNSSKKS